MTFSGPLPVWTEDTPYIEPTHVSLQEMPVAPPLNTDQGENGENTSSDRSPILIQRVRDRVWFPAWFINGLIDWKNPDTHH